MILVKSGCEVITKNDDNALLFSIERAGRTCYKSESKITKDSAIEFIKKIIKNGHHSVLEHENIQVRIVCDRGVSHEIVRHRLAAYSQECLTGDTEVRKGLTIKQLYDRQSNCYGATHNRTIHLRSVNINGNIIPNKMVEVRYKGQAEVYEVITKLGYKIRTTLNHEFQLPTKEFDILKNIVVGDKVMVNGRPKLYTFIENELEDLYLNQKLSPLEISQKTGCSYRYVLTELKNLGIFVCKLNDKNLEKYSKNHNQESVEKMRNTILKQYENGRLIWNRGMTGENSHSYNRVVTDQEREKDRFAKLGDKNPMWENGISRQIARQKKEHIKSCELCGEMGKLEVHHVDINPKNNGDDNLIKVCVNCHIKLHKGWYVGKYAHPDEITSISYVGIEDVYDIEMAHPYNNFIANGFVVHNSTRYCRYGDNCTFIIPPWFYDELKEGEYKEVTSFPGSISEPAAHWVVSMFNSESAYSQLLTCGQSPQQARAVLPNSLKTEIVMTTNVREWRHILNLRTGKNAHPQMILLMKEVLDKFKQTFPILFDDIIPN